jgi:signal transduction histidine kinase/DNA-binding response OmpR family regulator
MIYAFSKTGGMWRKTGPDLQTPDYILQFMEGPDHSLWVMTPTQGILVYDDVKSFFRGEVDTCSFIGIPVRDSYSSMVMSGNTVYLHYQHKVYRWDEKVDSFVFITGVDLISGTSSIGSTGRRIFVNTLSQGVYDLYFLEDDILRQDHWKGIFPSFQILEVFESKDMVVAFGPDGVLLWKKWSTWNSLMSEVTIRRADFNDKMRFGGYGDISISDLPHKKNKVHFRYALPYYINVGHHSYRYKLESYQDEWSSWNQQNHVTFTNLPPGEYIFSVEGRNLLGAISPPAELAFSIAAPWHQSWWAYGFYLLAGFLGMAAIVRFRSRQLRKEKLALQKLVMARTAELQVRNELLNEQTQQLAKHTEELKKVDKLKSRLFANISHEFRTPLTLLKGPLDRLKRFPESGLQKKDLEMMRRNTDRLLRLVNQLLDLSKVDAGTLPVNLTEGNLYKFLRALTSSFSSHAASRNIDYQIQIPPGKSWAAFDRDKLEKIVLNLLSNAFKFTGDDGWIRFEAIQQKDLLELSVADNGVGIPASELDSIFDRFYQVDDSDRKIDEGTGIGLALVKELVNLLNGTITVDSTLGEGTTFFAQLPIQEIQSPKSSDERLIETILEKMPRVELSKQKHIHANAEAKLVLVVEDNADMRNYVAEQLGDSYKVELAGSGQEGLLVAQESIPDLVVTDLMMPEMDGLELCKLLKSDERTSHIPVLVLTAKAGMNSKLEGLETGADVYLTKPFDARELKAQVQNLIRQREKLREIFATSDPFAPQDIHWTSLDQQFLQKLLDLLERKYQDPKFGSQELQKTLNLSKTVLYRKIKALTGQSPTEFLRNFRLKRAAQILLNNGETVSQTAFSVGFNNLSYFAKCFKELHGVSPSAYARKVQLSQDRDS